MVKRVVGVVSLLELQGVRLTPAFERDLAGELHESIAFLVHSNLIEVRADQRGEILLFRESRRRALDIYRNSISHFLVIPSIVARATLARRAKSELQEDLRVWLDIFYREYYVSRELYLSRGEALAEHFEDSGWTRPSGERWEPTPAGVEVLTVFAEQTRGVIEFYETATRILIQAEGRGPRAQLLSQTHDAFENARILGRARHAEAATDSSFDNVMLWLGSRDILRNERFSTGKRAARGIRYAPGEHWAEIESLSAFLASALSDR